jgi:hypothetical protein
MMKRKDDNLMPESLFDQKIQVGLVVLRLVSLFYYFRKVFIDNCLGNLAASLAQWPSKMLQKCGYCIRKII